jgi:hypothetical protein
MAVENLNIDSHMDGKKMNINALKIVDENY